MNNTSILNALPETAKVLADVIGVSSTLALAERCYERRHFYKTQGCVNVSIPKIISRDHWLMATLGRSKAKQLADNFGGEIIPLAKCSRISRLKRNEQIMELKKQDHSIEDIAAQFSINVRTVLMVIDPMMAERNRQRINNRRRGEREGAGTPTHGGGA